ncbi:MAG TPA: hypothetical protein PLY75_11640 [Gammaproteobacteria bacterium]|nr:hypothetical protein [Gammaproteobacteria bacterium]MCP5436439.1 hypothetical protein [Chromatiaceae bacterium]MCW5586700.1 hypothetical protein [Chromatiales bacterium]MCP5441368.1 hypothetical protein [Chromatiaceae bacterium]HOP15897.1 hypothetical protein [Gammaproteobacteria bacterium]
MKKATKIAAVSMVVVAAGLVAMGASAGWGEKHGFCDRAGAHGPRYEMGQHAGPGGRFSDRDLNLTVEQARTLMQARLIMRGNDRLKVGQVTEKDDKTLLVDIVTVDDSLVRQVEISRDSGFPRGPMGGR